MTKFNPPLLELQPTGYPRKPGGIYTLSGVEWTNLKQQTQERMRRADASQEEIEEEIAIMMEYYLNLERAALAAEAIEVRRDELVSSIGDPETEARYKTS